MAFSFTKMTALGNDFIMIDGAITPPDLLIDRIAALCDRRFGIGADGVIFVLPPQGDGDFRMRIFNSDGSEPQMCGNGIRCFALFVEQVLNSPFETLTVETLAGIKVITPTDKGFRVNMGTPILAGREIPTTLDETPITSHTISVHNREYAITAVSMGNPHAVLFCVTITDQLVQEIGPAIESAALFPEKCNVEFIAIDAPHAITMRVWERGCGETLACGTGACAAVVAGILTNQLTNQVTVSLPGGTLSIEWNGAIESPVFMTGAAQILFTGIYQ